MTDDEYTQGEIVRTLHRLEQGQAQTNAKLDSITTVFLPRGEFELVKAGQGREIAEIKADVLKIKELREASRAPWWSVMAAVAAVAAVAFTVIERLAT